MLNLRLSLQQEPSSDMESTHSEVCTTDKKEWMKRETAPKCVVYLSLLFLFISTSTTGSRPSLKNRAPFLSTTSSSHKHVI